MISSSPTRSMKIGDFLLRRLEEAGVRHLFGVPGDYNLELLQQLQDSGALKWQFSNVIKQAFKVALRQAFAFAGRQRLEHEKGDGIILESRSRLPDWYRARRVPITERTGVLILKRLSVMFPTRVQATYANFTACSVSTKY